MLLIGKALDSGQKPDTTMFGTKRPLSGSQLADALVTLRNMARANVRSNEMVASESNQMIEAWERSR